MFYTALLLLLPTVAYAQIRNYIEVKNGRSSRTFRYGTIEDIVSERERQTFQISDEQLKDMVETCIGKRPDDVYVRSPTSAPDLYKNNNATEIYRILKPLAARVVETSYESVILTTQNMADNNNATVSYNANRISRNDTITTMWSLRDILTVGHQISNNFVFGTSNSIIFVSFNGTFGENTIISNSLTIGTSDSIIKVEPGEPLIANITAFEGVMEVVVEYWAYLSGHIASNFKDQYKGQHFHFVDFNNCSTRTAKNNTVYSDVVIDIHLYDDPQLILYGYKNNSIIRINLPINRHAIHDNLTVFSVSSNISAAFQSPFQPTYLSSVKGR